MRAMPKPVGASRRIVAVTRRPNGVRCAATPKPPSSRSAQPKPSPSSSEHADATRGQRWAARAVAVALAAIETVCFPVPSRYCIPHIAAHQPRFRGTWPHPTRDEPCIGTRTTYIPFFTPMRHSHAPGLPIVRLSR